MGAVSSVVCIAHELIVQFGPAWAFRERRGEFERQGAAERTPGASEAR